MSVSTKLNVAIIGVPLVSLITSFFILTWYAKQITFDVYQSTAKELIERSNEKINSSIKLGITNAVSIANDPKIKKALLSGNRKYAIESLKNISLALKNNTEFKNIKIHLHTKDSRSFLRNWEEDKYGDDLSLFRAAIVAVNTDLKPINTFELGDAGLLLRSIVPVFDEDSNHIGSLEFIQSIDSIAKEFDENDAGFLLLIDENIAGDIKTSQKFSFEKNRKLQDYIVSQKFINTSFLNDANNIDIKKLFNNEYALSSKYFYTSLNIKDFQGKKLGIALLAKPLSVVNSVIDKSQTLINISLLGILIMVVVISFVIMLAVKILITGPLKIFENALLDFFSFLQGKKSYIDDIEIDTGDEFGKMAKELKENITVSAKLHEDINHLNENLEHEVAEKTREITALLNNAGQGFLSFSTDFLIDDEYSAECIKLLGKDIAGKDIAKILFNDKTKIDFFKSTILDINEMNNNTIKRSLLSLLPNEIILNKRALRLEYRVIDDNLFMMMITNISAQKKLEGKIKKEQQTLKMIVEIVTQSDTFFDTKKDYREFIENYENYIEKERSSLHNINDIYMSIHTFKGAFSQLYMNDIASFLHSIETKLSDMLKRNDHTNEELLSLLRNIGFEENLQNELDTIKSILGEEFFNSNNYIKINISIIKDLEEKIHDIFKRSGLKTKEAKDIMTKVSSLSNQKLFYLLKQYPSLVEQLAERLDKSLYELKIIGDEDITISDEAKPFIKTLIHVFKNAIDHGIEDSHTRMKKAKDPKGTISCSFERNGDIIEIIISDDGAGIDKEKVLKKALSEKMIQSNDANLLSDEEIYQFIFSEQFSTKDEVTDISGRGVGMSAVKAELEKMGGNIKIKTQKDKGTTFIFTLPRHEGEI